MKRTAIVLGAKSDIYKALKSSFIADDWQMVEWTRYTPGVARFPVWDLMLVMVGKISPVGMWHELDDYQWDHCMESNLLLPLRLLRKLWPKRNAGAQVCWFAGSNPNTIMTGYSAYNVSKMAVLKLVEQLDYEEPKHKFFAIGPGTVLTKIHEQTGAWPNPKLAQARAENKQMDVQRTYDCIKWCLEQPKEVIGGRNICVSDPWGGTGLQEELSFRPTLLKLRREDL